MIGRVYGSHSAMRWPRGGVLAGKATWNIRPLCAFAHQCGDLKAAFLRDAHGLQPDVQERLNLNRLDLFSQDSHVLMWLVVCLLAPWSHSATADEINATTTAKPVGFAEIVAKLQENAVAAVEKELGPVDRYPQPTADELPQWPRRTFDMRITHRGGLSDKGPCRSRASCYGNRAEGNYYLILTPASAAGAIFFSESRQPGPR